MNSITLTGNIVRNVVKTELNEGAYVVNNCIAVKRFGKIEATDFINIKVFGKQVDNFCNLCDKGTRVLIQGQLQIDTYKNKEDKTTSYPYVLVNNFELLYGKKDQEQQEEVAEEQTNNFDATQVEENDLPF